MSITDNGSDSAARGQPVDQRLLEWLRQWSYAHPRLKLVGREAWAHVRRGARAVGLPAPFEPPEFADLRRLAGPGGPGPGGSPPGPDDGPKVLILTFRGWSTHVVIEATIGHAMAQHGLRPVFASCGGRLPVCDVVPAPTAPPMPCASCASYVRDALSAAGFEHHEVRDLIDLRSALAAAQERVEALSDVAACAAFRLDEMPLGNWVGTSVLWFLSRGTVDGDDPLALGTYKQFLVSAQVLAKAFAALLEKVGPDRVFLLNGSFFPERILAELADRRAVPVVRYERGFTHSSLLVSRWRAGGDDLDPGDENWQGAADVPLEPDEQRAVAGYLADRVAGSGTFDAFWKGSAGDGAGLRRRLGLPPGRPLVALFCNILWDSAIQGKDQAFASMPDWVSSSIKWAARHPELHLVIRVHPAEVKLYNHRTREPIVAHIERAFPELPANVTVVPPESPVNSYDLASLCAIGLVYTSTLGLEMACAGIPVAVAAHAHYARRGFTIDTDSEAAYWRRVDETVLEPPGPEERREAGAKAQRYAYLFFFRFHQTLRMLEEPGRSRIRLHVGSARELGPGNDPALDRIIAAVAEPSSAALVTPIQRDGPEPSP